MSRTARAFLVALAIVAAGIGAYAVGRLLAPPPERVGTLLENPQETADLALTAAGGQRVTLGELAAGSDWTLVFFGFVDCPDVCPLTMGRLAETYRELDEPENLRVAMITIDPERDDPERLEAYVDRFHPSFVGLGGSSEDVAAAAKRFFVGYSATKDGTIHTEAVALLDDEARLRAVYTQGKVARIGDDLVDLLEGRRL